MGMRRNAEIKGWQEQAGIEEATGQYWDDLDAISQLAFDLIKIVELEKSGIRDGDGHWSGSWPLGGIMNDLVALFRRCTR